MAPWALPPWTCGRHDVNHAGVALVAAGRLDRLLRLLEDLVPTLGDPPSHGRDTGASLGTLEEGSAEACLELIDSSPQGLARPLERLGRGGEGAVLHDRDEGA